MGFFFGKLFIRADICCEVFLVSVHASSPVCLPMCLHPCPCTSFPPLCLICAFPGSWNLFYCLNRFLDTDFFWLLTALTIHPCLALPLGFMGQPLTIWLLAERSERPNSVWLSCSRLTWIYLLITWLSYL